VGLSFGHGVQTFIEVGRPPFTDADRVDRRGYDHRVEAETQARGRAVAQNRLAKERG